MKLTYAAKVRIAGYLLPLLVVLPCAAVGYRATHSLFAQPLPPLSGVSVTTTRQWYHVGQIVTVILTNNSSVQYFVDNNCPDEPLTVYRHANDGWVQVHARTTTANCLNRPSNYLLPAHKSIITDYRYWQSLFAQPGTYRITMNVQFYSNGPSTEFRIVK